MWAFYSHVMNDELIQKALVKFQRGEIPGDVAAVFDRETGDPDLDGRKWRFVVTDGKRVEHVEAELAGSNGGSPGRFDIALLEAAIERRIASGCYQREQLMDELAADGPKVLREDDLRPHPTQRGESFFF